MPAAFDFDSHLTWLRCAIALTWLVFGGVFKALGALPRHRRIVARVVGDERAGAVLRWVAAGEISIGLWMLYGRDLVPCVALQSAAIVVMNTLELRHARDLLLSPRLMLGANAGLLTAGWYVALSMPS
jgi:hypothetical protein